MAHERRAHLVPALLDQLGLGGDAVAWDTDNNRWHTGRRAWEMADPSATHHLVLQDDAVACRDLIPGLEAALAAIEPYTCADGSTFGVDEAVVSPYTGTRRPLRSVVDRAVAATIDTGASWIIMRALMWGVGILAPTRTIEPMLAWCDRQTYPNYDRRVGRYYYLVECWPIRCTVPSLIDHLDHDIAPSICNHGPGRVAHNFAGVDASALEMDWSRGHVVMPGMQQLDEYRRRRDRHGAPLSG